MQGGDLLELKLAVMPQQDDLALFVGQGRQGFGKLLFLLVKQQSGFRGLPIAGFGGL